MDFCKDTLKMLLQFLTELRANYITELQKLEISAPGNLVHLRSKGKPYFYTGITVDGTYKRKYISSDKAAIRKLARKEFLKKSITIMDTDIKVLSIALKNYRSLAFSEILPLMKKAYSLIPESCYFTKSSQFSEWNSLFRAGAQGTQHMPFISEPDEWTAMRLEAHKEWAGEPYKKNDYPFGDEVILAADGTRMRSKAELICYEKLREFNVPFRYDMQKWFGDTPDDGFRLSPDFTFQDACFNEFYLEYCGMMNDSAYVRRHLEKRALYEAHGIVPWNNIIYIYAHDNSFDAGFIESIIRHQIIPRL